MTNRSNARAWISRRLADKLYERIIKNDGSLAVYFVEASAGIGKTYLARDIGTRLGSQTGYGPSLFGNIIWSGILDVYDPDTNSGSGMERRLIEALTAVGVDQDAFADYYDRRAIFESWRRTGIVGAGLEDHRRKVEQTFADCLKTVATKQRLVLAFDTVERLERASDPTQQLLGYYEDTASITGWLLEQIAQLHSGVVLLFGRHAQTLCDMLHSAIKRANQEKRPDSPIEFHLAKLDKLDTDELAAFFRQRRSQLPDLQSLLSDSLQEQMIEQIGGNPLLLDLALLALNQTHDPDAIDTALREAKGIVKIERSLIATYKSSFRRPEQARVLDYLAIARNGLFAELLHALAPLESETLAAELAQMETLPFIKVRELPWMQPGEGTPQKHPVYFLHDTMYAIYDEAVLKPQEAQDDTQRIVKVYDRWIAETRTAIEAASNDAVRDPLKRALDDLRVESAFYRMRSDPQAGYQWYLKQTDRAIRNSEIGYDMRLRNELVLFMVSAGIGDAQEAGESLTSQIDQANVKTEFPQLSNHFLFDSVSSWIKRLTVRGGTRRAGEMGESMQAQLTERFLSNPEEYRLAYAEFLLWLGQATMYAIGNEQAQAIYRRVIDEILSTYLNDADNVPPKEADAFTRWRLTMVLGRTYNNMGYLNWLYFGRYRLAIQEFQRARALFLRTEQDDPSIQEELANANDNLGRVYAQLGKQFQPLRLIRNGLEIRERLGLIYRTALSLVSLAHAYLRLGDYDQGLVAAEKAMVQFNRAEVQRGIGLGLLARGMILRNRAENWRERGFSVQEALADCDRAETDLRDAVRIFTGTVAEPIRTVQAYNELGSCYRARFLILQKGGGKPTERDFAYTQARLQFREALKVADANGYTIERLDTLQDLAVLSERAGQHEDATRYLKQVADAIGAAKVVHKIVPGEGLIELPVEQRIDAYYKLMGQVELLTGAIEYECARRDPGAELTAQDLPDDEAIIRTSEHYLLAVAYFQEFGEDDFAHRQTYERIYKRFQYCRPNLMRRITQKYIPEWIEQYQLPEPLVRGLFQDVFPLLD